MSIHYLHSKNALEVRFLRQVGNIHCPHNNNRTYALRLKTLFCVNPEQIRME